MTPPDAIQALVASISAESERSEVQGGLIFASAARIPSMIGLEASGRRQSSARVAVYSSMARTWRVLRTTCFSFMADVMPMLTKSSLLPLVVMEPVDAG